MPYGLAKEATTLGAASITSAAAEEETQTVEILTEETVESSPQKVGALRAQVRDALERRRSPAKDSPQPAKGARAAEAEAAEKRRARAAHLGVGLGVGLGLGSGLWSGLGLG